MASRRAEQFVLDQLHDEMLQGHMKHLDLAGLLRRDDDRVIHLDRERSAVAAEEGDRADRAGPRRPSGGEQVRAPAAGTVQDQEVTRPGERVDLPGEDLSKPRSLPTAVSKEASVVRATAAKGRRVSLKRTTYSVARCWASAALPPLPQK